MSNGSEQHETCCTCSITGPMGGGGIFQKAQSVNNKRCDQNAFLLRFTCPDVTSQAPPLGIWATDGGISIYSDCPGKNRPRNICQHSAVRWLLHASLQMTCRSLGGKLASFFVVLTQHSGPSLISIIPDPPPSLGQPLGSAHDCKGVSNNHRGLRFLSQQLSERLKMKTAEPHHVTRSHQGCRTETKTGGLSLAELLGLVCWTRAFGL